MQDPTPAAPKPEILAAFEAAKGFMPLREGLAVYEAALDAGKLRTAPAGGRHVLRALHDPARGRGARGGRDGDHRRPPPGQRGAAARWEYHDPATVDPEIGRMDTLPTFRRTLHKAGLEAQVVAMVGRSPQIAAFWRTPLGLVFIDGGHTDEHASGDYEGWAPHVAEGGLLLIHDVFPDPADEFTGQAPYRVYLRALESGAFTEVSATDSLRVLRRTGAGI